MADQPIDNLAEEMRAAYPELEAVRDAATDPVYLVGGAVRDLLLGRGRSANLDLVVEGDATALAGRLGGVEVLEHERFATATVRLDGVEVDIAAARTETYAEPGALPEVSVGATIEEDLGRRDFTINAMAMPLDGAASIDPHGGGGDLEAGVLRVLHGRSFVDDPTRALRAARYAARLDFELEAETEGLVHRTQLGSVSADRREAELLRLAAEQTAARGFELLATWGLVEPRHGEDGDGIELAGRAAALLSGPPWESFAPRGPTVLRAALGPPGAEAEIAAAQPRSASEGFELASGRDPADLALARAMGAEWLDRFLLEWSRVELEIDGEDLLAAGVEEGPAVGRGLAEARRRKLDGEVGGRKEELDVALTAARKA